MAGWIKLHRDLLNKPIFENEKLLKIWVWCLLKAYHEPQEVLIGRQKVFIDRGQFPMKRSEASEELNLPESTFRDYLQMLKNSGSIDSKSTNKYSVITIANWESYQREDKKPTANPTANPPTNGQQMDNKTEFLPYYCIKNNKNIYIEELQNQKLKQTLQDFISFRERIGKPLDGKGFEILIKKLDAIGKTDDERIKILEKSILKTYTDIYPLNSKPVDKPVDKLCKGVDKSKKQNKFHNFSGKMQNYSEAELEEIVKRKFEKKVNNENRKNDRSGISENGQEEK